VTLVVQRVIARRRLCWTLLGAGTVMVWLSARDLRHLMWLDDIGTLMTGGSTFALLLPWLLRSFRARPHPVSRGGDVVVVERAAFNELAAKAARCEERLDRYDKAWFILGLQEPPPPPQMTGPAAGRPQSAGLAVLRGGLDDGPAESTSGGQPVRRRSSSSSAAPRARRIIADLTSSEKPSPSSASQAR
jgi:hypothetical protein